MAQTNAWGDHAIAGHMETCVLVYYLIIGHVAWCEQTENWYMGIPISIIIYNHSWGVQGMLTMIPEPKCKGLH